MRYALAEFFLGISNLLSGDPWDYDAFNHGYREALIDCGKITSAPDRKGNRKEESDG